MKAVFFAFALLVASCAAPAPTTAPATAPEPPPAAPMAPSTTLAAAPIQASAATTPPVPDTTPQPTVATARGELAVYPDPWATAPSEHLPAWTILGTPTVVRIIDAPQGGWAQVSLPGRPNGRVGWIKLDEVDLSVVTTTIHISLSERNMEVWKDGSLLVSTPVAVGTATSPTPTGVFFVTDAIDMTGSPGPWGPFAFGLSARSDVITEFNGGDGIIGIHGTNRPSSIGEARSLGCVRVPNEVILELAKVIELGTTVEIRA